MREQWARDGVYEVIDELYDLVLVYGHREIYDVIDAYGLSHRAAAKTRFVGYLRPEPPRTTPEQLCEDLGLGAKPLLLVTAGGGGIYKRSKPRTIVVLRRAPEVH